MLPSPERAFREAPWSSFSAPVYHLGAYAFRRYPAVAFPPLCRSDFLISPPPVERQPDWRRFRCGCCSAAAAVCSISIPSIFDGPPVSFCLADLMGSYSALLFATRCAPSVPHAQGRAFFLTCVFRVTGSFAASSCGVGEVLGCCCARSAVIGPRAFVGTGGPSRIHGRSFPVVGSST